MGVSLHDNSPSCDCYAAYSNTSAQYFLYHRFYDFRYLASAPDQYVTPPPFVTQPGGNEVTRDQAALNSTGFSSDWDIEHWGRNSFGDSTYAMWNSPQNIYISPPPYISSI
jgi:hypothetical protein